MADELLQEAVILLEAQEETGSGPIGKWERFTAHFATSFATVARVSHDPFPKRGSLLLTKQQKELKQATRLTNITLRQLTKGCPI